jgi:probable phosphoglycerate mutase
MATFYICRHGETENNHAERLSGWVDTPLTEKGVGEAKMVGEKASDLGITKLISSDLGRAFQTAYIISRTINYTGEIAVNKDLREVNYGELANQPYSAYPDLTPEENTTFVPEGGESLQQMHNRVLKCLSQLEQDYGDEIVLIIAHDGTINAVRANLSGESAGQADTVHNPQDVIMQFTIEAGIVTAFNQI